MGLQYEVLYVASKANLADGPSRNDLTHLQKVGAVELDNWFFPDFSRGLDGWMNLSGEAERMVAFVDAQDLKLLG